MHIRHYSKPSPQKREGEDALLFNPELQIYGVMDGVTPIADYKDSNGHNGAYLAANLLKTVLERPDAHGSLDDKLKAANGELRRAMIESGIDMRSKHELWASCIAAVQVTEHRIRYVQLGDCMIVARYADGRIDVLTENRVAGIRAKAKAKRERDRQNGMALEDEPFYADLYNSIVYNRTYMANTPEGYGVCNGTEEAVDYIQSGFVPMEQLTHLLLVSDGMFHPELPLERTMEIILQESFDRYVEQVEQAERDKRMNPDDRSAVLLHW